MFVKEYFKEGSEGNLVPESIFKAIKRVWGSYESGRQEDSHEFI